MATARMEKNVVVLTVAAMAGKAKGKTKAGRMANLPPTEMMEMTVRSKLMGQGPGGNARLVDNDYPPG